MVVLVFGQTIIFFVFIVIFVGFGCYIALMVNERV